MIRVPVANFAMLLGAAIWGQAAQAGAFNPPAGEGIAILTGSFSDGRDFVDGAGRKFRSPAWRKFETQLHIEYGLTDWLTAVARPRVVSIHEGGRKGFRGEGVGASEVGLRARIWQPGEWVFAVQALARAPAASAQGRFAQWEDRGGVEARMVVGRRFVVLGMSGFFDVQIGVRTRAGRADELIGEQTLGLRPTPSLLVMAQTFTTQSLESPKRLAARGAPLGAQRVKTQLSLLYDLAPRWSLGAAAFRTLAVRDGAKETGASLSLLRRF